MWQLATFNAVAFHRIIVVPADIIGSLVLITRGVMWLSAMRLLQRLKVTNG
ncbi:hypothetical protein JK154_02620 [Citrobacter sp. JGM124]|nr:hypothetical protein [Citrobacter sp. JGM124]